MQKTKDPGLKKSLKGHNDSVMAVDFHPDSSQVASGSLDASVLVWKLNAKQVPNKFVGHTGSIYSVAYNPTGTLIATGSADNTVRIWENDSRGKSTIIKSHSGPVRS
jgi:centriolar protein POC1